MDTMNTLTQSGGLRMRLNVSTRVPAEVKAFYSEDLIHSFESIVGVEDDF